MLTRTSNAACTSPHPPGSGKVISSFRSPESDKAPRSSPTPTVSSSSAARKLVVAPPPPPAPAKSKQPAPLAQLPTTTPKPKRADANGRSASATVAAPATAAGRTSAAPSKPTPSASAAAAPVAVAPACNAPIPIASKLPPVLPSMPPASTFPADDSFVGLDLGLNLNIGLLMPQQQSLLGLAPSPLTSAKVVAYKPAPATVLPVAMASGPANGQGTSKRRRAEDEDVELPAKTALKKQRATHSQVAIMGVSLQSDLSSFGAAASSASAASGVDSRVIPTPPADSGAFTCDTCSKTFASKASLNQHQLRHTDLFKCGQCGLRAASSHQLQAHMARHQRKDGKHHDESEESDAHASSSKGQKRKATSTAVAEDKGGGSTKPKPSSRNGAGKKKPSFSYMDVASDESSDSDTGGAFRDRSSAARARSSRQDADDATAPASSSRPVRSRRSISYVGDDLDVPEGTRGSSRRARTVPSYAEEVELDPYSFVEPEWFANERAQPFACEVDPLVLIVLDIHSHLLHTEVIGLLGGRWSEKDKRLRILSAHPCRTLSTGNDHVNVELDPISQIEVAEQIAALGQITVGWYHSHPVFRNDPSVVDVQNQMSYQSLFRDNSSHGSNGRDKHKHKHGGGSCTPSSLREHERSDSNGGGSSSVPFLAAIVTPFGSGDFRPSISSVKWFTTMSRSEKARHARHIVGASPTKKKENDDAYIEQGESKKDAKRTKRSRARDDGQLETPMELWTTVKASSGSSKSPAPSSANKKPYVTPPLEVLAPLVEALLLEYRDLPRRVDFNRAWEPDDDAAEDEDTTDDEADPSDTSDEDATPPPSMRKISPITSQAQQSIASLTSSKAVAKAPTKAKPPPPSPLPLPSTFISTKLDQFLHSLSGHVLRLQADSIIAEANLASSARSAASGLNSVLRRCASSSSSAKVASRKPISPYYAALTPAHAKFVRGIMRQVEAWKQGDEDDEEEGAESGSEEAASSEDDAQAKTPDVSSPLFLPSPPTRPSASITSPIPSASTPRKVATQQSKAARVSALITPSRSPATSIAPPPFASPPSIADVLMELSPTF